MHENGPCRNIFQTFWTLTINVSCQNCDINCVIIRQTNDFFLQNQNKRDKEPREGHVLEVIGLVTCRPPNSPPAKMGCKILMEQSRYGVLALYTLCNIERNRNTSMLALSTLHRHLPFTLAGSYTPSFRDCCHDNQRLSLTPTSRTTVYD